MCASRGDHELTVLACREVDDVVLLVLPERRAADLDAADRGFLVGERGPVPDLGEDADPARDHVRPAAHPGRVVAIAHPGVRPQGGVVLGHEVVGAVLEPHQVARRDLRAVGARRAAETGLRPTQRHHAASDARQVADGVERDLRVVGTRLHHQVAAAAGGLDLVAREARQVDERFRALRRQPEAVDAVAFVGSSLPAASVAFTSKVWVPLARLV